MIRLDQSIPFVRATMAGDIEEAAAVLNRAEQRFGLKWSKPAKPLEESDSDAWLEKHLWPFMAETHFVLSGEDMQTLTTAAHCELIGAEGLDHTPSWRHWGGVLADWANLHWFIRPSGLGQTDSARVARPWTYLDFYSREYLSYLIMDYDLWIERLVQVVCYKNASAP